MKKLTVALMLLASLGVSVFSGVYMTREFTKVVNLSDMGDMWSFLRLQEDSPYAEFTEVDLDDFTGPPYPVKGDILVEIDGVPPTLGNYFSIFTTETPPGLRMEIKFLHDYQLLTTTVETRSIPLPISLAVCSLLVLRTLIVAGLILVGLWAVLRKPFSSAVRTLILFCFAMALQMCMTSTSLADTYASFDIPKALLMAAVSLSLFTPALWLKLQLVFPARQRIYAEHRISANLILFLPALVIGMLFFFTGEYSALPAIVYQTLFLATGFVLLVRNHRRAVGFIEQRQTRLVLWGSAPGITLYGLMAWFVTLFPGVVMGWGFSTDLLITNLVFLFMLLIPLSFAYAFGRYKLLEVEGRLKRGTRLLAVNLLLLLLFFGLLYLFGAILLHGMGIRSQTPTLILGILMAFAFMPTQKRLSRRLERHFYPERARLRQLLRDFLASGFVRAEDGCFWRELETRLADGLSAERILAVLKRDDGSGSFAVEKLEAAPFAVGDGLVSRLETAESPVLLDELLASGRASIRPDQEEWLRTRNCAVLLPLCTKSGLIGFLLVGSKTNGEDFTAEELELLQGFAPQIALVTENLDLMEEKFERRKLEEQLVVARNIQKGLLPGRIPEVPGLEVEALIRFCLEVAGDYYDMIPLPGGRIVLSIGDVAGKGVGPALLMANLQASLRTTQAMGASLAESAEKINRLVFENTPSDMFITFFMVLVDPVRRMIRYVNAGHNPPLLISGMGRVQMLSEGGLLFGVVRDTRYREGVLPLRPGDLLLMYTDGVCEAMNGENEEYGEKRLADLTAANREIPLADLLGAIENEVCAFHGSREYADDFTLLAARLKQR